MFADAILATAVLDRLVHHAHVIPIVGESYRTKAARGVAPDGIATTLAFTARS